MRNISLLLLVCLLPLFGGAKIKSFHDFTVETTDGQKLKLSTLKGKKVLVVNVASKCGLTPQYEQLQQLYSKYGGDNFTILAFPANNFKEQEPGSNKEIQEFCTQNYGVTFPVMAKISVKGDDMAPLYQWLTKKAKNGKQDADVLWNFQKFMIDEQGNWVDVVAPRDSPMSDKIIKWVDPTKN